MNKKKLFIHTTTLFRAVLLLGTLAFVTPQQTQAQTAKQWAEMPDAFETMDPATIIGDGQYYYIQFYTPQHDKLSYLTDRGVNKLAAIMDFLPYANNRLWTLESAGDNNFKLKSKAGYYIGFDRLEGASGNRYVSIANSDAATTFTFQQAREKDGYNIVDLDHGYNNGTPPSLLGRNSNAEWITGISPIRNDNTGKDNSRMRFAKLKSNVAYIIYYRGEGTDNSAPNVNTTRHYLTYSGADAVSNGSLEGDDNSSFFKVEQGGNGRQNANISGGVGKNDSRGIVVHSANNPSNVWDTQFFIRANRMMTPGTTVHLEFDYKASQDATVSTQGHSEPQSYVNEDGGGDISFTTEWQHLSRDFAITGNVQTIAFNLAHLGSATDYYFDNITFNITSDVSSRQSIIPKDKPLCTLPTLAAYHQDGLWTLEETGNGDFYIKKYGDEQYLTVQQIDTYNYRTVLGNKDNVHGRFNLEDPNANRYTRVHNNTDTGTWGLARYLTYNNGDGSPVVQSTGERSDYWYASFYPVEVPVPNKDEFYRVLIHIPVIQGNPVLNENGGAGGNDFLWELEQVDDYLHFRLKNPQTGRYLAGAYQMTEPNDPTGAEVNNNAKFFTDFSVQWFYVNPVAKEIPVDYYVKHKESYLRPYAAGVINQEGLRKQGLATDVDSEWWNFDGNGFDDPQKGTQKTNHFEITHFVKKGNSTTIEFPTVLNENNDHILFQRFYNYNEKDTLMDLDNLKAHVSLDTRDDGNVQYFLYKNGMVTGQKLDWTDVDDGGYARYEKRRFNFTNSDGQPFTVAVDVSRYSDLEYLNSTAHLSGDLREPSLTMRYLFFMNDAKAMAKRLTACPEGSGKWLEEKEFHFGRTQVPFTKYKKVGYRGEFIPVRHVFSDYWVYDDPQLIDEDYLASLNLSEDELSDYLDQHLVSAVNNNEGGKIVVEVVPGNTGIRKGGYNPNIDLRGYNDEGNDNDYQGFYFYDRIARNQKTEYGKSRFVVFRYPESGIVENCGLDNPAYVRVYLNAGDGKRYQLAQFTIYFDANMATRPWTEIKNGTTYANGVNLVKGTNRDPNELRKRAGKPIAKISFDYPVGETYHYPTAANCPSTDGKTRHDGWERDAGGSIDNSSPVPLTFGHTNYSFDGDGANWGSYALVTQKRTTWGNNKEILPADDATYGYNLPADPGMQKAFLYIDASEQPGDICAVDFEGEFCASDQLMCTGWISGCNRYNDDGEHRCPGSITLTVKGEDVYGNTVTIYRFCPGQIYELDNGYNLAGGDVTNSAGVDGSGNNSDHVVWQQFYFEFSTDHKYERYWLEVNNNCVSSNGGDFMLDNVEVYTIVPEVKPDINTPLCVSLNDNNEPVVDMRLLKLNVNFNKLKSSANVTSGKTKIGFVFLEKDVFLKKLWDLKRLESTYKNIDSLALAIKEGRYLLDGSDSDYKTAFDAALLGNKSVWDSSTSTSNGAGVMYFEWDTTFENNELYTFAKAVNKEKATFRYTDDEGDWLVFNGNYPVLPWKTDTEYYIVPTNNHVDSFNEVYGIFDICSACSKASAFKIEAPYTLIGLGASEDANDYMVCEGQIPTLVSDLKGYDFNGVEVPMNDINYDWWLGDKANGVLPTLENYHAQQKDGVKLDVALSTLRIYYPEVTSLDGITGHAATGANPELTPAMVSYLQELVDAGQLVLHQKSISVPAEPAAADDPYFYLVACPIHDEQYDQALNPHGPASLIENGDMESYEDVSFVTRYNDVNTNAAITHGVGINNSRGIAFTSAARPSGDQQDEDSQFFIFANEMIPEGTKFHLKFRYKASAAATVPTEAHSTPGNYIDDDMLGDLSFTTEWQCFERDITVTSDMANGRENDKNNSFQTIAFNLWRTREPITYYFDDVELTVDKNHYIAFFCDEPQGLRVKVGEKAPTLKTGFVSGENGFESYDYTGAGDAILSIRLAKREQFETVKHGEPNTATIDTPTTENAETTHFLWLPLRNASVQSEGSDKVIQKSEDENIYLASTNDPVWDKQIYKSMKEGSLPIVGKIVQLNAIDVAKSGLSENDYNRLCIYFTENFEVREGYSYTLSLPFQESPGANTCDGTILINLKIVPDYEVWTGAAGNTDWNNDENWRRADGNLNAPVAESTDGSKRNNNELLVSADLPQTSGLYDYKTNFWNYRTAKDRIFRKGFAPLYCTHVLIKSNEWGDAPVLYDALDTESKKTTLAASPFPNLRDQDGWDDTANDEDAGTTATKATATPILRYDMQARLYDIWSDTYGTTPNKGRAGDLIAEMYQINSCDEIAFQPSAELLNAHLLNYNNAWVEYQLDNRRWYLLGSPLQGTISGEWYAPTGTAQQKTTYYEPVTFGKGYDRYSPAIYQRSWDKAKAVLYEVGSEYTTTDNPNDLELVDGQLPGSAQQGVWNGSNWNAAGADAYLDRLGYKPLGDKKANVAIKGVWSNTYNDATVDYTKGGFSVMVMNHLKNNDESGNKSIIRLPKEDTMYDYYKFEETGANDGGTDTYLSDPNGQDKDDVQTNLNRAKNRGRLKTDLLLPTIGEGLEPYQKIQRTETTASRYGDARTYTRVPTRVGENALPMTLQPFTETVSAGISNMGYYLVENPFPCGLDMEKFFATNTGLEKKYWILTSNGQQLVQLVPSGQWISPSDGAVTVTENEQSVTRYPNGKVAPGQGFFVQATTPGEATTITFTTDMQAQTRYGEPDDGTDYTIVVGTKQKMTTKEVTYDNDNDPSTPEVPVMIDHDNDPNTPDVQATVEVPVVNEQTGEYEVEDIEETVTIYTYKQKTGDGYQFPLKARRTRGTDLSPFIITAKRGDMQSSALVMERESASDDFLPEEDTEVFINSDLKNVPTVYTLCGRLATTINSIRDFRCLPLGVESASDAPCVLTFQGVEALGDSVAFYDAVEQKLTPLESGMQFSVSGQTQNRYYLVRTLNMEEAKEETHLLIFNEGLTARVIASTEEPVTSVRCFDTAGRLVLTASPQTADFSFSLPAAGVYVIEAHTEKDHKTRKVMVR